jgi:hypothetical protein
MSTTATKPVTLDPRPCNARQPWVLGRATRTPDARQLPVQLPRETGWQPYPAA